MAADDLNTAAPRSFVNRFDRMEWAGAFGDLGTFIPFVVAYTTVLGIDPFGVLLAFGASLITCGLYYKTPFPVQGRPAGNRVDRAIPAQAKRHEL